jgi:hypothetical protein
MKKVTLLMVVGLLALGATSAWAQGGRFVISPTVGYRTTGDFGLRPETEVITDYSGIKFQDGLAYGLSLGYRLSPYITMEAGWTRSVTMAQAIPYYVGLPNVDLFDVAEDVIHANFLFYFGENALMHPFFVTGLGVTLADGKAEGVGAISRFTTYVNDQMAWWYDWWWGGYYLVPVSQYMGQWEFTAALVYRF